MIRVLATMIVLIGLLAVGVAAVVVSSITLEQLRDVVVIVYGVMGILLFVALTVAAVGMWFALRALAHSLQALLEDPVRPTLQEVRDTARNVRGATEFLADTAVHPLIRVLSIGRGVKRGVGRVARLARRR